MIVRGMGGDGGEQVQIDVRTFVRQCVFFDELWIAA